MTGWLYVLELLPTNCIKVGRTEDLVSRLTQHLCATKAYGVSVARIASFAVDHAARDEARLLAALRRNKNTQATDAPETFAGISFDEVLVLVADVRLAASADVASPPSATVEALPRRTVEASKLVSVALASQDWEGGFLGDVLEAVGGERHTRTIAVLNRLVAHRPEIYGGWGPRDLKIALSRNGVATRKTGGQMVVRGADVARAEGSTLTDSPLPSEAS